MGVHMRKMLFGFILFSNFVSAAEGLFEKHQTFRALAFGPRDETCSIVAEDITNQMEDAENTIIKMNGIIVNKMIDPCLFSVGMQTSMFGEITYLIPEADRAAVE